MSKPDVITVSTSQGASPVAQNILKDVIEEQEIKAIFSRSLTEVSEYMQKVLQDEEKVAELREFFQDPHNFKPRSPFGKTISFGMRYGNNGSMKLNPRLPMSIGYIVDPTMFADGPGPDYEIDPSVLRSPRIHDYPHLLNQPFVPDWEPKEHQKHTLEKLHDLIKKMPIRRSMGIIDPEMFRGDKGYRMDAMFTERYAELRDKGMTHEKARNVIVSTAGRKRDQIVGRRRLAAIVERIGASYEEKKKNADKG